MIRHPFLYKEPFRLKHIGTVLNAAMTPPLTIEAGLFSQQMALPWQADFNACADGAPPGSPPGTPATFGWWPSQRPIIVTKAGVPVRWDRGVGGMLGMVTAWSARGFVVKSGSGFDEEGGP